MKTRNAAFGMLVLLGFWAGCGDDDSESHDAGPDSGMEGGSGGTAAGRGQSGSGGRAGMGAAGGSTAGSGGGAAAGSGGDSEQGGAGGQAGSGSMYSVGGSVSGLMGSGLVLKNNGGPDLSVNQSGDFTFNEQLADAAAYAVTVATQPSNPTQTCSVASGSGTISAGNVTNVSVTCSTDTHTVGGSVSGLGGGTIVLKNNGGDALSLTTDGSFMFATAAASGAAYAVTIDTPPSGKTCGIQSASGTVGSANVTNVAVTCYAALSVQATPRVRGVTLSWNDNGATSFDALRSSDANCNFDNLAGCADQAQVSSVTSPYLWTGLENGKAYYFQVRGAHAGNVQTKSAKTGARPNRAQFDGSVLTSALGATDTVYVGGTFSQIGVYSGSAVPLDIATGLPGTMPNFPTVQGQVSAIVSDGNHGYFIGGNYTEIGPATRNNLAHVLADGSVDATWNPNITGAVSTLALAGTTLYLGGQFTQAGGQARPGLAAVDATGAGAPTSWNPGPNGSVNVLVTSGDTLYVGGDFTQFGATARSYLAAFALSDGALKTDWHPDPTGPSGVRCLALAGNILYAGGYFQVIAGATRLNLGAVDAATGAAIAGFAPNPNMGVTSLAVRDTVLYAAGEFTNIGGKNRINLAAVNTADGVALDGWDPAPDASVDALVVAGDTVFVGGEFTMVGGAARPGLAGLSASMGTATGWNPRPDDHVTHLYVSGDTIYVSGQMAMFSAEYRSKLASFTAGALTNWNPEIKNGDVMAMRFANGVVYAGGTFDAVGNTAREAVAAIDGNAAATAWNAQLSGNASVYALALDATRLYIGGAFSAAGGGARTNLAGLAISDGNASSAWDPAGPDGTVRALAIGGTTLYLGGEFLALGATARQRLAAVDNTGALVTGWNPGASATVRALATDAGRIYVGGDFTTLGGSTRNRLGAVGENGTLSGFNPDLDGPVNALWHTGSRLYVGGDFGQIGGSTGEPRLAVAAFEDNEALAFWQRNTSGSDVNTIVANDTTVYIGGNFYLVGGTPCNNFFETNAVQ